MNEVKLLNIGGIDQNIKDQYARDVIAPSENRLDSSTNLPVSSRHYDEGAYLIGQDRQYYIAITEIDVGDTLVVGTNVRATTVSDEIIALKNQSADTVLEVIADVETSTTASKGYSVGKYLYWNYGLSAGMYKVIAEIDTSDALVVDTNIEAADKIMNIISVIESKLDTIKYSNHNLLDNPWFTVNQRGVTSINNNGQYPADRWQLVYNPGGCTITRNDNLLLVDNTQSGASDSYLFQLFEDKSLVNKTVTASVMLSDGTIIKGTGTIPELNSANDIVFNDSTNLKFQLYLQHSETGSRGKVAFVFRFYANCRITIKAVKLEVGSVSTLANDTAPNYAEELLKCQRYYYRTNIVNRNSYSLIGLSRVLTSDLIEAFVNTPCIMRTIPSVILNGTPRFIGSVDTVSTNPTAIITNSNNLTIGVRISGFSNTPVGNVGIMIFNDTTGTACIEFSADL